MSAPQEQPDGHTKGLIERLESAEGGSRLFDAAIWGVLEGGVQQAEIYTEHTEQGPREALVCELGTRWADNVGHYTTSLDAALSLAERVLPGQARSMGDMAFDPPGRPWAVVWTKGGDPKFNAQAATPALALCAAILRAKEQAS